MASTGDGGSTGKPEDGGEPAPGAARTPAEYVALLRRLKERSGLTFRQLEQRAAERGEVLARSTLADVLRRDALPRAEVVSALVRACGVPEGDVPTWLAARERLAVRADAEVEAHRESDDAGRGGGGEGGREAGGESVSRTRTASLAAVASLGTVALLVVGVMVLLLRDGSSSSPGGDRSGGRTARTSEAAGTPGASGDAGTSVPPGPDPGLSRIRPVRAPELCLTDGDVRGDDGESKVVAMQRPCGEAVPPKTYLLKADDGYYRIQWDHPQHGKGCLTLLSDSGFQHMFEPWDDCKAGGASQLFRIERAGGTKGAWRLRPGRGEADVCVGMRGGPEEKGAVAVAEDCVDPADGGAGDAQLFLIGRG